MPNAFRALGIFLIAFDVSRSISGLPRYAAGGYAATRNAHYEIRRHARRAGLARVWHRAAIPAGYKPRY